VLVLVVVSASASVGIGIGIALRLDVVGFGFGSVINIYTVFVFHTDIDVLLTSFPTTLLIYSHAFVSSRCSAWSFIFISMLRMIIA